MKRITDKTRLDFLQGLMKRKEKCVGFNGVVGAVAVDSSLQIGGGRAYLMRRDRFGHGDDAGHWRSATTVLRAIDKAIRNSEKEPRRG